MTGFWLDDERPRLVRGEWEALGWLRHPVLLAFFVCLICARLGCQEGLEAALDWLDGGAGEGDD